MSLFLTLCLTAALTPSGPPLAVTRVVREGPPPYEDSSDRLYRIEGDGCLRLKTGDVLILHRDRERRILPRLEVVLVASQFALARVASEAETFPLRGDLAYPREIPAALPSLPELPDAEDPAPASLLPVATLAEVPGPEAFTAVREPLFYLAGETRITPKGRAKLKAWVGAWGRSHRWSLICCPWPGENADLNAARVAVLTEELQRLGVDRVTVGFQETVPEGHFPVIFIAADPW